MNLFRTILLFILPACRVLCAADAPARVMLDDFSTISSYYWDDGPGSNPDAERYWCPLGSAEDSSRDDGWCGRLEFDFLQDNGEGYAYKNEIYKTFLNRNAVGLRLWVNPQGFSGRISLDLERSDRKKVRTVPAAVSGSGWREIFIPFEPALEGKAPFVIHNLIFTADKAGKGEMLIDDLQVEYSTLPEESAPLGALPVYRQLGWRPGEPAVPEYRFRNRLGKPFRGIVKMRVGEREVSREVDLPPYGAKVIAFDFGVFDRKTALPLELTWEGKLLHRGWVTVFEPNRGRLNRRPMWFSVEDQELNNAPAENALHASWLPLLGVDMIRAGVMGNVEMTKGRFKAEALRKLWQPHIRAGLMLQIDYAGYFPPWVAARPQTSPMDCNWAEFDLFMEHLAKFFHTLPGARYFEFINEPNLHDVTTPGSRMTDHYMAAIRRMYPIFKKHAPEIQVMTGGVCPDVPYSQPGFIERLMAQPETFDAVAYHEHSEYPRYADTFGTMRRLMGEIRKPVFNTEAGFRSRYTEPDQFYRQAAQLVKKIAYSKAAGMEGYNWFMVQDFWDKGRNAERDDTFGLVTIHNQPKPSFAAYAELIRQLANRMPGEAVELDRRLDGCRFEGETDEVFVLWPRRENETFDFMVRSDVPVEYRDIYGNSEMLPPRNGIVMLRASELPFYLRTPKKALTAIEPLLSFRSPVCGMPGDKVPAVLLLNNPYGEELAWSLAVGGIRRSGRIGPGEQRAVPVTVAVPPYAQSGMRTLTLPLTLQGKQEKPVYQGGISLNYFCCEKIAGTSRKAQPIILDSASSLRELVFDPRLPAWQGPEDLSAEIAVWYSEAGLSFDFKVTDQEHCGNENGIYLWRNDCVQIGIAPMEGEMREYAFSLTSAGPEGYCHIPPPGMEAGPFQGGFSIVREGNLTRYRITIPGNQLGFPLRPGTAFRMALLVCDNDSGVRLRTMNYFAGIDGEKNTRLYGVMQLSSEQ